MSNPAIVIETTSPAEIVVEGGPVIDVSTTETVIEINGGSTVARRLKFNVQDYGANPDAVQDYGVTGVWTGTDNTAAILAAYEACLAAGGGIVFFPVGRYLGALPDETIGPVVYEGTGVGSRLILPLDRDGYEAKFTYDGSATDHLYQNHLYGCGVRNMFLDGHGRMVDAGCLTFEKTDRMVLNGLQIRHFKLEGLEFTHGVRESVLNDVYVHHCGSHTDDAPAVSIIDDDSGDASNNINLTGLRVVYFHGSACRIERDRTLGTSPIRNIFISGGMFHGRADLLDAEQIHDGYIYDLGDWELTANHCLEIRNARTVDLSQVRFNGSGRGKSLILMSNDRSELADARNSLALSGCYLGNTGDDVIPVAVFGTAATNILTGTAASTTLDGDFTAPLEQPYDITVVSTTGFPAAGSFTIGTRRFTYTGLTATTFTGVTGGVVRSVPTDFLDGATVSQSPLELATGAVVRIAAAGGTIPGGVTEDTDYFVGRVSGSAIKLYTTRALAVAAVAATEVDLTSDGSGDIQILTRDIKAEIDADAGLGPRVVFSGATQADATKDGLPGFVSRHADGLDAFTFSDTVQGSFDTGLAAPGTVPAVRIYSADGSLQSIAASTYTSLLFDVARYDPDGMFNIANPSRITFKRAGLWRFGFNYVYSAGSNGARDQRVLLNGSTGQPILHGMRTTANGVSSRNASGEFEFAAGDYIEVQVFQADSASPLLIDQQLRFSPEFWASYVGPLDT